MKSTLALIVGVLVALGLLACVGLEFPHPDTGVPLAVHALPASDYMQVARALGWDAVAESSVTASQGPRTIASDQPSQSFILPV